MTDILLVEDDRLLQRSLGHQLQRQGYKLTCRDDGESGLEESLRHAYGVVVLDVMLPKMDGLSLCKELRARRPQQPIVLISARGSDLDQITGLEFGADDYLAKPFSHALLEARIRALLRRSAPPAPAILAVGGVVLDRDRHQLRVDSVTVRLTPKEMALLRLMMSAPGRVFTRECLLAQVWGLSHDGYHRAVDAHINRLRNKLEKALGSMPAWLEGVYGVGYRFAPPPAPSF